MKNVQNLFKIRVHYVVLDILASNYVKIAETWKNTPQSFWVYRGETVEVYSRSSLIKGELNSRL